MRVSVRLALLGAATGLVLFGTSGVIQLHREQKDLKRAAEANVALIGRSLRVGMEHALRDDKVSDVTHVLSELERVDNRLDIYVYDAAGGLRGVSPGARLPPTGWDSAAGEGVRLDPENSFGHAIYQAPLRAESERLGTIVVVRPLDEARRDLARERWAIALTMGVFLLSTTLLIFLAAELHVGRPIDRLIEAMHRIRSNSPRTRLGTLELGDEFRRLEAEFDHMRQDLAAAQQELKAEADDRRRLQQVLQDTDKLVTVGQLSAGLAHEIGSPLQVIHGRASALVQNPRDPERTARIARILVEQSERITRIVEQLLSFARRKPMQRHGAVDVGSAATAVVELLEIEAARRGVALKIEIEPDTPRIFADHDQIQQVVMNLVTNALSVTAAGGSVRVWVGPGRFERQSDGEQVAAACIHVEDTGHGMDPSVVARLFEPFFTTRAGAGGTGLGLAIVQSIVTAHGGKIEVDAEPERGARFRVLFPIDHTTSHKDHAA